MSVRVDPALSKTFGAAKSVGSVYDAGTQLSGNFNIFRDGYANTIYEQAVSPLSGSRADWAKEAKLDWKIGQADTYYEIDEGSGPLMYHFEDRKVLFRTDTNSALAVVGKNYKPVQPADILDFFGDVADKYGFHLELAGEALNGRRIFGMAQCPQECVLPGGDALRNYLIMVTHNDGTGATRCFFSSIRLWCMNQLPLLINNRGGVNVKGAVARQTHSSEFDVAQMASQLSQINDAWAAFEANARKLQETPVSEPDVLQYMARVFEKDETLPLQQLAEDRTLRQVMLTYEAGVGQDTCKGTAWGALNGVTRYLDYDGQSRTVGSRLAKQWLGEGRKVKERAYVEALQLAA